jgi:hypothetical protein
LCRRATWKAFYDILNFMTGDDLMTHQLPRAFDEMKLRLLAQHPNLAGITGDTCTPETHAEWLADQIAAFGETLPVRREHQFHEVRDPIAEAEEQLGKDRVIVVR